ncbi:HAD family hydrolase [Roseibium marinum]|uniref:Putative hydrolase of the HAD superfamily n=1 Tax=Roseibium marinum TaxID=281252 RepID=A0A2S3UY03_9HYPH|nr:HAD hydrolase-like protein [Roseibium marinum]POF32608.1 putative hydrolase of the HAD superfamily [Roseibium marinum]
MIRDSHSSVFVDADNTLWDTDKIFANAQLQMLEQVESLLAMNAKTDDRLRFVRILDQKIAEHHHQGLKYPPQLLVGVLTLAISGIDPTRASRLGRTLSGHHNAIGEEDTERLARKFYEEISRTPELRTGVLEGLRRLQSSGRIIIVVTEAARGRTRRTAGIHCVDQYFDKIIEAPKHARLYRRVQRLVGQSSPGFMVGDQLERDIRPAKEAGLTTIFFPSGFKPLWEQTNGPIIPDYTVNSFSEAADIVIKCK